jgi:hypothetical protein
VESLIKMEVKIAKVYIQQGFPDHVAGFYTYLGSIPYRRGSSGKNASFCQYGATGF